MDNLSIKELIKKAKENGMVYKITDPEVQEVLEEAALTEEEVEHYKKLYEKKQKIIVKKPK